MTILYLALGLAAALAVAQALVGRRKRRLQANLELLQKRFGLEAKVYARPMLPGFGERRTLSGEFRGYSVALYDHYLGRGRRRRRWTSLTLEALFAEDLELRLEPREGDESARFEPADSLAPAKLGDPELDGLWRAWCSDPAFAAGVWTESLDNHLKELGRSGEAGSLRLSKGFLEYRESEYIDSQSKRLRFQTAFLVLAELADVVSIYATRRKPPPGAG